MMKFLPVLLGMWLLTACASSPAVPPTYEIQGTKPADQITFEFKNNTAYFDVNSPSGVGSAYIIHTQGGFPNAVAIRFHLKGLESLNVRFETSDIQASVSSDGNHDVSERGLTNASQNEIILTRDSEYWMPIEIISASKSIPLQDGYFQALLPRAFFSSRTREFYIEWIDFFR